MTAAVLNVAYWVLLVAGAVPAIVFPVYYTVRAPWWRSEMGRHLFAFSLLFALLYVNALVGRLGLLPRDVQVWVGVGFLVFGAVVSWQRLTVFWHARRRALKTTTDDQSEDTA